MDIDTLHNICLHVTVLWEGTFLDTACHLAVQTYCRAANGILLVDKIVPKPLFNHTEACHRTFVCIGRVSRLLQLCLGIPKVICCDKMPTLQQLLHARQMQSMLKLCQHHVVVHKATSISQLCTPGQNQQFIVA